MRYTAISAIALLSASFAAPALAAPAPIGIAAAVVRDVRIRPSGGAYNPVKLRQRVAIADQVRTGEESRLQILLLDKTKFTVGANAQLTIDKFVYDPDGGSMSATVAKGAFRFMSGGQNRAKIAALHTPAATIGIRGTILDGAVGAEAVAIAAGERAISRDVQSDPATATLIVLRGPGPRTQGRVNAGAVDVTGTSQTVTLDRPMLAAYMPYAGAEPIGPFEISPSGLVKLDGFILPALPTMAVDGAPQPVPDRSRDMAPYYGGGYPDRGYPANNYSGGDFSDPGYRGNPGSGGTFVPGLGGLPRPNNNQTTRRPRDNTPPRQSPTTGQTPSTQTPPAPRDPTGANSSSPNDRATAPAPASSPSQYPVTTGSNPKPFR